MIRVPNAACSSQLAVARVARRWPSRAETDEQGRSRIFAAGRARTSEGKGRAERTDVRSGDETRRQARG
jgi:hypothetical protein